MASKAKAKAEKEKLNAEIKKSAELAKQLKSEREKSAKLKAQLEGKEEPKKPVEKVLTDKEKLKAQFKKEKRCPHHVDKKTPCPFKDDAKNCPWPDYKGCPFRYDRK